MNTDEPLLMLHSFDGRSKIWSLPITAQKVQQKTRNTRNHFFGIQDAETPIWENLMFEAGKGESKW